MPDKEFSQFGRQVVLNTEGEICGSGTELLRSPIFKRIVSQFCDELVKKDSPVVAIFRDFKERDGDWSAVVNLLRSLEENKIEDIAKLLPETQGFLESEGRHDLHQFVESLYNYWRSFDRFMVLRSELGSGVHAQRPYRAFNSTVEKLTHVVRAAYRDICENITGSHPTIYRQVAAGFDVALIAVPKMNAGVPEDYRLLTENIPFIRQLWIQPPLIVDPPMNKRTGQFTRIPDNPFTDMRLKTNEWLCYPAQVGPLVIWVYFHESFIGLGCSLANLFELASDEQLKQVPDAIFFYGVPTEILKTYGDLPTVFYDDDKGGPLVGGIPAEPRFGYFGYLKKMILTLHNIAMMKKGCLPYHGAMLSISLKNGKTANILLMGDTATGKSETIEAFRTIGGEQIQSIDIIADDMGSLAIREDGKVLGYGTEIGAFVRLDDMQAGYAFEQIDRAILMSPYKVNARVVVPVTTLNIILKGYPVDYILYANNFEPTSEEKPILGFFQNATEALETFRGGKAMAKGTTTSSGLTETYFANVFGPPQYRDLHEPLAKKYFEAAYKSGAKVGQLRTQLGVDGFESKGPAEAAKALLKHLTE
jgi:hypothetical protein